jgi:hypothetical protein
MPSLLLSEVVSVVRNTWGQDADDARSITAQTVTFNVPAAVQPGTPVREAGTGEDSLSRVTQYVPYTVDFQSDPGLQADDEILWTDPLSGVTHTIIVEGSRNLGQTSGFQVEGIERL